METLASLWGCDPSDLSDLGQKRHEPEWESQCVFNASPPAGLMWTEQLSPHLQRNKQLQDTLLQREEELARLQEENVKLREFLSSSFVRNLEQKAKKLTANGRRKLKRSLAYVDGEPFRTCSRQQVSKRVCRNLTAEFCSESSGTSTSSEPNLDLWVLRTLGLKDRDTIDTTDQSSSDYSLRSLVYNAAATPSSSPEHILSPPVATSTPSSVHSYCQRSTPHADYRYSAAECQETNCDDSASSRSPGDLTATGLTGHLEAPRAVIRSYNTSTAFQPDRAEICSSPAYWTPSQDTVQFSPPAQRVYVSPMSSSPNQPWTHASGCNPTSPPAASQPPATPPTPRSRTDLAFSMSLNPSSSVKTHSFPQGQAFVRKDTEGRWNFTWVPRQGPETA